MSGAGGAWATASALVLLVGLSGCSEVIGLADLEYDREPAGAGGSGAGGGPPGMVAYDDGAGQTTFIDAREVTVADYAAWLDGGAVPSLGGSRCAFNDSLVPLVASAGGDASNCETDGVDWSADQAQRPDHPVRCLDWCDAADYCAQHGKRLCGRVGGGTVATSFIDNAFVIEQPLSSEWYRACSRAGERPYPYGDAYEAGVCNGSDGDGPEPVGARTACEGGYSGLFDMSGNVEEWEDACDPPGGGADAACMRRGGAYYSAQVQDPTWLECGTLLPTSRGAMGTSTGFRCCAGP